MYVPVKIEIAGYCVLRVLADEGELQRIAVFSEYRRQGVGRKLMEAMLAAAREEGASSVSLEVRESNVGAMRLYEEYGFCQEAVRKKCIYPGAGGRCSDHVEPQFVTGLLELRRKIYSNSHLKLQNPVYIMERNRTFLSVLRIMAGRRKRGS